MALDRMQAQRFELKYNISETVALEIRNFVGSYLELDEYGATFANLSYPVHSLYLDSDGMATFHATINGDKNRFKLRLRFYESRPNAPVYFEIKRRTNNTISKMRGGVKRQAVDWLLAGHLPEPDHLVSKDPKHLVALQKFCQLTSELHARPKAHIAYSREAWISTRDNSVRVTMDRDVRCAAEPTARLCTDMVNPVSVFGNRIILELKFTNRFPDWFKQLVRVYGLMQCGAAKYVDGVGQVGIERVSRAFALVDEHSDAPPSMADLRPEPRSHETLTYK